ncbi:Heterogeneous nuclear ribonucleoprotein 87F [Gryllus bimaculatus]|nr:Heterogeneous nuclear ribonucleoprotein 87F [Gryllus bimaculatus]
MSRLIVKNLANSVTEAKLKEVFSEKGNVTDVQLKYTSDGKFRHFGFVGFLDNEQASQAVEYFNNTFINGSRIRVEFCAALGDPNKPKAWSKHCADSSAYKKIHQVVKEEVKEDKKKKETKSSAVKDILKNYENDPVFSEFMEARTKGKEIWRNDIVADNEPQEISNGKGTEPKSNEFDSDSENVSDDDKADDSELDESSKVAKSNISDMEYLKMKMKSKKELSEQTEKSEENKPSEKEKKKEKNNVVLYTVKLRGLKYNSKKQQIKKFFSPLKPYSIRLPKLQKGIAYVGFKTEKMMKLALMKHRSFLEGRQISVLRYEGDVKHSLKARNLGNRWEEQAESLKNEEAVAESGRIFVRNLAYTMKEDDLEALFAKYGPLTEVIMPIDRFSRKPKGFAVITFLIPEHAVKAFMELDGSIQQGRMMHLIPAKSKKSIEEMLEMDGLTYKQKKALKEKAQASSSNNWNTLFLGQNAVADLIAKNYNTTKEKVLDTSGKESLAVRLALGETQIVSETRQFLLDSGVQLDAFNQNTTLRSKTVILVKNLPAGTTSQEMCQLFAKFGELGRVLLPPSGVTAIVEFLEPSEARAAFRKLAYKKFKHIPLFLEWAPSNTFSTAFAGEKTPKGYEAPSNGEDNKISNNVHYDQQEQKVDKKDNSQKEEEEEEEEEEDEEPEPDTTLFVKNLNFETREDAIKEHFKKCGRIHDVTVALKKDPKNPGKMLSMGYGFIQFKKKASLEKALKSYQNAVLDGYSLELKRSNRTLQANVATGRKVTNVGKQTGSKILVRNIPFQATQKEIRELFQTFGEIKALRLPQKMVSAGGSGAHRGFAFVEYYTKHDAKRAFKSLGQSTHLYGRRLVLEWAKAEENVEELRKKTASQFQNISSHYQRNKSIAEFEMDQDPE